MKQAGFAFLELVLVIVIIGAIVVIGLWVYQKRQSGTETTAGTAPSSSQSPVAKNVSSAPQISSTDDLDKALTTLNQNDPAAANSGDQSQLDSQTSF
jgi:Tfp pilus assembly major pilin PilA